MASFEQADYSISFAVFSLSPKVTTTVYYESITFLLVGEKRYLCTTMFNDSGENFMFTLMIFFREPWVIQYKKKF